MDMRSRESPGVRDYDPGDEVQWVRCRVVSFLDCAYYDDVAREKPTYDNPAIELVAVDSGRIVGLMDIELEPAAGTVCRQGAEGRGGMIWELAVHPDHRRRGIATALLAEGRRRAQAAGMDRLEAWTRDDAWVRAWYEARSFSQVDSYLHVWLPGGDAAGLALPGLRIHRSYAEYSGPDRDKVRSLAIRCHECCGYELQL